MNNNKKNIIIHFLQILILIFFVCSFSIKTFQNDTFFTIAIGERILKNGVEVEEKLVWHEGLEFTNSRWLFDVVIALINNHFGFLGIYIFVLLVASAQCVLLYFIINKITHKKFLSFCGTLLIIFWSAGVFTARAQIISFLIFTLEFYFIERLLETDKKRYCFLLLILSLILVNMHASVFPMYFVIFLPYIVEQILVRFKLDKSDKIIFKKRNIKKILIIFLIAFFIGFCTPKGLSPYTDMFKVMDGISTKFIEELKTIDINHEIYLWGSLVLTISILIFTKTKIRVTDAFFILGFALMSLSTYRCIFFYYFISMICILRFLNDLLVDYKISFDFISKKIRIIMISVIYIWIVLFSIDSFIKNMYRDYIDASEYPINATEYILENIDILNMKIYNGFNFGSYLEYKGIKAFLDSRSGVFTDEFNPGVTILNDWYDVYKCSIHYNYIFDKYGITHVLLNRKEKISTYIIKDSTWKLIYQDDSFELYERVK